MAKSTGNYKVKGNKIICNIANLTDAELEVVKKYRALGYEIQEAKESNNPTKEEMLANLKDTKYFDDYNTAYSLKQKDIKNKDAETIKCMEALAKKHGIDPKTKKGEYMSGYHLACKIYGIWKKEIKENKENN